MSPEERVPPKTPSVLEIALAFTVIGLTSVGGAAGPLRHMLVKKKQWISEGEYAELQGLGQALPGAVVVNVGLMVTDRFVPLFGPLASLAGLIVPAMVVAIALLRVATTLAVANPRFLAAEVGVTAALAGIFLSNGLRVLIQLWKDFPDVKATWRSARIAIGALGTLLVAGLHLAVPLAMLILITLSMLFETRLRAVSAE